MPTISMVKLSVAAALIIGAGIGSAPATIAEEAPPARSDLRRDKDKDEQDSWRYPGSERLMSNKGSLSSTRQDGTVEYDVHGEVAEYATEAPFHQVVRFYVERSGGEPPDWSIFDREFPSDVAGIPMSLVKFDKGKNILIHHGIRSKGAAASLLIIDAANGETISITISRNLDDDKTHISFIRHVREAPPRGDAPTIKR